MTENKIFQHVIAKTGKPNGKGSYFFTLMSVCVLRHVPDAGLMGKMKRMLVPTVPYISQGLAGLLISLYIAAPDSGAAQPLRLAPFILVSYLFTISLGIVSLYVLLRKRLTAAIFHVSAAFNPLLETFNKLSQETVFFNFLVA
jgi:hypothetical protein